MVYPYILFDADDTLFDYAKAESYALTHTLEHEGIDCTDEIMLAYQEINQQLWREFEQGNIKLASLRTERFARLIRDLGLSVRSDVEFVSEYYLKLLGEGAFLIEGAVDISKYLIDSGIQLAIITNGIKKVQMSRIGKSELAGMFAEIIVSEDTGYQKPHPGIFDYAFAKLRIKDKNRVLIIGDSLTSDIKGGIDYGIDTCWFNPHHRTNPSEIRPVYEIHRLEEIRGLIDGARGLR